MPLELSHLIQEFAKPLSRPDWRVGSQCARIINYYSNHNFLLFDLHQAAVRMGVLTDTISTTLLIVDCERRYKSYNWFELLINVPYTYFMYEMLAMMMTLDYHRLIADMLEMYPERYQAFCDLHFNFQYDSWSAAEIAIMTQEESDFGTLITLLE